MTGAALLIPLVVAAAPKPDAAAAAAQPLTLALIVASNRGVPLDRPALQYADDDGAKYHAVLASVAGEENTILLAELDRDTARLFPSLVASVQPPTQASVKAAAWLLAERAGEARKAGRAVRFYFVFAGHGDVDRGRGFLELPDGPFGAADLEGLLRAVNATEAHVILDACNSFFVVNPRRPGGRRFATPRDAAEQMARRLQNVGVFLSTSAEAEVFEWSELQSGIFSHAVRSGLLGAADADGDGRVSYLELAAFVDTAAAEIKNPLYRPKVFARGPGGRDGDSILDLRGARARAVVVDDRAAVRLTVRDREGLRWLDAHKEAGAAMELRLPSEIHAPFELSRLGAGGAVEAVYVVEDGAAGTRLAALAPKPSPADARGAGDLFRALFTRPFGPAALSAWVTERAAAPEPVYGISREQAERMALLLDGLAASEHERRVVSGSIWIAGGAGFAVFVAAALRDEPAHDRARLAGVGFSLAAAVASYGVLELVRPSAGERTHALFRAGMAAEGGDQARVVADTDTRLRWVLSREARSRSLRFGLSGAFLYLGVEMLARPSTFGGTTPDGRNAIRLAGTVLASGGFALGVSTLLSDTPAEKLIELWSKDPAIRRAPALSAAPVPGGGVLVVSGEF